MIDNTFNKLLTEEMGIIRNVQTDTTAIADKIKHLIKNTASSPTSFDMTTYKNGIFQIDVTTSVDGNVSQSKKTINVKWYYFSFSDEQTKEDAITKIPMRTSYNKSINTLSIVVLAIRGVIDSNTLEDSIAHELTHNFQTHLKGDKLLSNDNIKAKYQAANRNFVSSSESVRVIASVLYLTYKFEQDAFLNGAYAYIMSEYEKGNDVTGAYEKTDAYNSLHSLRSYLDNMQNAIANNRVGEMTKEHCKSEYNLSFEKIITIGEKAYSRYSRKLARMYAQALADIRNKNIMESETYHTMYFYMQPPLEELKKTINETIFK